MRGDEVIVGVQKPPSTLPVVILSPAFQLKQEEDTTIDVYTDKFYKVMTVQLPKKRRMDSLLDTELAYSKAFNELRQLAES